MKEKFSSEEKFVVDWLNFLVNSHQAIPIEILKNLVVTWQGNSQSNKDVIRLKHWLYSIDNQKRVLSAILNGYEIEEEKYIVPLTPSNSDYEHVFLCKQDEWDFDTYSIAKQYERYQFTLDEIKEREKQDDRDYQSLMVKVE